MNAIIAESIIAEMAQNYNQLVDYYTNLDIPPPGLDFHNISRKQYAVECSLATWKAAAFIVARQAGIKLTWGKSST
jgi:hypothetical protein